MAWRPRGRDEVSLLTSYVLSFAYLPPSTPAGGWMELLTATPKAIHMVRLCASTLSVR